MHLSLIQFTLLTYILSVINHYSFLDIMEVNNNNDGEPECIGALNLEKNSILGRAKISSKRNVMVIEKLPMTEISGKELMKKCPWIKKSSYLKNSTSATRIFGERGYHVKESMRKMSLMLYCLICQSSIPHKVVLMK